MGSNQFEIVNVVLFWVQNYALREMWFNPENGKLNVYATICQMYSKWRALSFLVVLFPLVSCPIVGNHDTYHSSSSYTNVLNT